MRRLACMLQLVCLLILFSILSVTAVPADEPAAGAEDFELDENPGVAHIEAEEITTEEDLNVTTLSESIDKQLDIALKIGIIILVATFVFVAVCYRAPNKYGLSSVLLTRKKDAKTLHTTVKASKKIPYSVRECEVMALMSGMIEDKYLLFPQCMMEFISAGQLRAYVQNNQLCIAPGNVPAVTKSTPAYVSEMFRLITAAYTMSDLVSLMRAQQDTVDAVINSYVSDSLKTLDKQGVFAWSRKVHGVRVYYTGNKTRQLMLDIMKILKYFDVYGVENLESSTRDQEIVNYARLVVLFDIDMEAQNNNVLRTSLLINRQLQKAVLAAFPQGAAQ